MRASKRRLGNTTGILGPTGTGGPTRGHAIDQEAASRAASFLAGSLAMTCHREWYVIVGVLLAPHPLGHRSPSHESN